MESAAASVSWPAVCPVGCRASVRGSAGTAPTTEDQHGHYNSCRGGRTVPGAALKGPPQGSVAISRRLGELEQQDLGALRAEWRRLFRTEPPQLSRDLILRAVAHRLQERAHGGHSKATLRRLANLVRELRTDGQVVVEDGPADQAGHEAGSRMARPNAQHHGHGERLRVGVCFLGGRPRRRPLICARLPEEGAAVLAWRFVPALWASRSILQ